MFYKVDVEIFAYLTAEKNRQDFCQFEGYLKFSHQSYNKWCLLMPYLEKWSMKGGIKSKNFRGKGESKKSKKLSTWFVHAP